MVRFLIVVALLAVFVAVMKLALLHVFTTFGFWPGMIVCLAVGCTAIAAAFAYDRAASR